MRRREEKGAEGGEEEGEEKNDHDDVWGGKEVQLGSRTRTLI